MRFVLSEWFSTDSGLQVCSELVRSLRQGNHSAANGGCPQYAAAWLSRIVRPRGQAPDAAQDHPRRLILLALILTQACSAVKLAPAGPPRRTARGRQVQGSASKDEAGTLKRR
jgi:hypothetical protein